MPTSTVKVFNLSLKATKRDIEDFFSFSGEIKHIELQSEGDSSQVAFVTFKDPEALDTALLLSGATIVDHPVNIIAVEDYNPNSGEACDSSSSALPREDSTSERPPNSQTKAQDVVASMLAKGFILGKDAVNKAKGFDEKHKLTTQATASISNLDKKFGLSEKIAAGTSAVNEGMKSVDQKYGVSEKTKVAFAAAEEKVNSAGSALMRNKFIFTSASWVAGAFNKATKAATEMGQKTKEKDPTP